MHMETNNIMSQWIVCVFFCLSSRGRFMPHAHLEALSELPGAAMPTALIEGLPLGAWEMDIATDFRHHCYWRKSGFPCLKSRIWLSFSCRWWLSLCHLWRAFQKATFGEHWRAFANSSSDFGGYSGEGHGLIFFGTLFQVKGFPCLRASFTTMYCTCFNGFQ